MAPHSPRSLGGVLREHGRSRPQQPAVVCGPTRLTYCELDERVDRLAAGLAARGAEPGARVLWLGLNCHMVLEAFLACARLGAIFCPVNWRQSPAELAFVLRDAGPAVVLLGGLDVDPQVRDAADGAVWVEGPEAIEDLLAPVSPALDDEPARTTEGVLMLYTAAFEGRPNGAVLSQEAVLAQNLAVALLQGVDGSSVYLNCGPLFHIATFMSLAATFHAGGKNVFTPKADPEELCRLIEAERCTSAFLLGPTMTAMAELNADGRFDLRSLRIQAHGQPVLAGMVSPDDTPWGRRVNLYGQTEVMGLLTIHDSAEPCLGSHGRPTPVAEVRIVDPDGREVPPGEVGEIVARGPIVMNRYHDRPALTAARQAGGWHHTNDLGRREADGSITFVGPFTRIVKTAGENVYPAEVEACLRSHPAVAEAAVIGVPDEVWTQSVKAVVVLRPGQDAGVDELVEHCRARIASYKKPRVIEFVDALPRRDGAVDYADLDGRFGGGGYPGGAQRTR